MAQAMAEKGYNTVELAKACSVRRATISRALNAWCSASHYTIGEICRELNISVDSFVEGHTQCLKRRNKNVKR